MGPRGGGAGFGFPHMIVGMMSAAILFALFAALVLLAVKLAKKKGWIGRHHHDPHHHGPNPEPGAPNPPQTGPPDAQQILDERLARGEIEVDDYRIRRDALSGNSYPPFNQPPTPPVGPPHETRVDEHPPHVPPAQ